MRIFWLLLLMSFQTALAQTPTPTPTPVPTPKPSILPEAHAGFAATPEAAEYQELCPSVRIRHKKDFKFINMEIRLACGDQNGDAVGTPWSSVPPNQAAYFMRGFLQARGHHQPKFIQDGSTLFVDPGPETKLAHFKIIDGPPTWDPPKRRLVEGQLLTPGLLDDLQAWSLSQVKNEGYACATAQSVADPKTGEAVVDLKPDGQRFVAGFHDTGDSGLREGVLDRYDAFRVGDLYREYLIALTRKRTQDDGFLQTYIMSARCNADDDTATTPDQAKQVTIVRNVVLGPARTVQIGVGASTDVGGRLRAIVRQNRIGPSASSAQVKADLSELDQNRNHQSVSANFRWFETPNVPRAYLEPSLIFDHTAEQAFENQSTQVQVMQGWTHELESGQVELRAGPTFLDSHLFRGQGPSDVTASFVELDSRWLSHQFEYFATSPRTGEHIDTTVLLTQKKWGANFTAQKVQIQGEKLWQVGRYDPPFLILGTRFNLSSVFSPDNDISADLPVRFLTFLGGDQDLRGFDRSSLPRSGVGSLSGATGSFETRFHKVIFRRADAFVFVDSGLLGGAQFHLNLPILMSPGAGVRWESPVGVLRLYLAQRFALYEQPDQEPYGRNIRLGFTFGEEF